MAPQQPARGATTSCTPSASSTRAVAELMLGAIAGCTQPSSNSILRAWTVFGQAPEACGGGTLVFRLAGKSGRINCPIFIAGENSHLRGKASFSALRIRRCIIGRGTWSSTTLRPMSTRRPYWTPEGHVVSQARQVRQRSRCSCV